MRWAFFIPYADYIRKQKSFSEFVFHKAVLQIQIGYMLQNGEFVYYGFSMDYYLIVAKVVTV